MEFTKIRLLGRHSIDLPIVGVLPSDPYILKSVTGLGPAENDLPGMFNNLQPVILMALNPDYTIGQRASSLRETVYNLLAPRVIGSYDGVTLQVMNGETIVAQISGYISKIEPVPFAKDQELQVTMTCNDSALNGPFLLSPLTPLPADDTFSFMVNNIGSAPAGVLLDFTCTSATAAYFQLSENIYGVGQTLRVDYPFVNGDRIKIDTRDGHKSITVTRLGNTASFIGYMSPESTWYKLPDGVASFMLLGMAHYHWNSFQYTPRYWGL